MIRLAERGGGVGPLHVSARCLCGGDLPVTHARALVRGV